jgi:hypothetical protein
MRPEVTGIKLGLFLKKKKQISSKPFQLSFKQLEVAGQRND